MKKLTRRKGIMELFAAAGLVWLVAGQAGAHCDTMDGPVVSAAMEALDSGNVNLALVWVQPGDEAALRDEFENARAAREAGGSGSEAAEHGFLEALVRIHRAGEGAPYAGIRPAGTPLEPAVRAADESLQSGSLDQVRQLLSAAIESGLQRHFEAVRGLADYDVNDLSAGRDYVRAYVGYTHFVEGLHRAATAAAHEHAAETDHGEGHGHAGGRSHGE